MFEQTSRLAEKLASSVSRRGFLGSLGGWAAAAAMGVAGVLTGTGTARAASKQGMCCFWDTAAGSYIFFPGAKSCPIVNCCGFVVVAKLSKKVNACSECPTEYCNGCPC
jgi:hypothetical protein